jgi:hypothetical protein
MITKVNLPAAQLQVAMGIPLHMISDIRRLYGCQDIFGTSVIDFDNTERTPPAAHCIAGMLDYDGASHYYVCLDVLSKYDAAQRCSF